MGSGVGAAVAGLAVYCALSGGTRYAEIGDSYPGLPTGVAATVGYFLESRLADCLERNRQREGKERVPDVARPAG